jgi:crotonobetainyl-CoA:carnitine CoA-transferase CaiB-like acyl-CoA transferase
MKDTRFATNPERVKNRDLVCDAVASVIAKQSSEYWLTALEAEGVPCGPINTIDQVFSDPQLLSRGMRVSVEHPMTDTLELVGNPIHYSRSEVDDKRMAPLLGQDTENLLNSLLDYSEEEISAIKKDQAI